MATFPPTIKNPHSTIGGGGFHHRHPGGGGGDGRGDHEHDSNEQVRRYRLAVAIALVSIMTLFVSFTLAFVLHEKLGSPNANGGYTRNWQPVPLPVELLLFNTGLLILSSLTLEKARRHAFRQAAVAAAASIPGIKMAREHHFPWLNSTLLLGLGFVAGQLVAWRELMDRGIYMSRAHGSSFFYIVTGMHAVHLLVGIVALFYAAIVVYLRRGYERRRITLEVTSWYWHSMTVLWVYILFVLVVVR